MTTDKHTETEAPEGHGGDHLPDWSVGTIVAVLIALGGLLGSYGSYRVTTDHVDRIEAWQIAHTLEVSEQRKELDKRLREIESVERTVAADHDKRLVLLEDHWRDLLNKLDHIEVLLTSKPR